MSNDVPITAGAGTNVETLQQSDADQSHRQVMHMADFKAALSMLLDYLANPIHVNNNAQMRVSIENIAGALTLNTINTVNGVTTVTTVAAVTVVNSVTNLAQLGGFKADSMIFDNMAGVWANCLRGRIA